MTRQKILSRVQKEADDRIDEIIDHLLLLLNRQIDYSVYINKWEQSGMLDLVYDKKEAAILLEQTAKDLALEFEQWTVLDLDTESEWDFHVDAVLNNCIRHLKSVRACYCTETMKFENCHDS